MAALACGLVADVLPAVRVASHVVGIV